MLINSKQQLFIMNGIKSSLVIYNKDASEQRLLIERKKS